MKGLIAIFGILVLVGMVGGGYMFQKKYTIIEKSAVTVMMTGATSVMTGGIDFGPELEKNETFMICSERAVNDCFYGLSRTQKGENQEITISCESITNAPLRKYCQDTKIISSAKQQQNAASCDSLGQGKTQCLYEVIFSKALASNDREVCSELKTLLPEGDFDKICTNNFIIEQTRVNKDPSLCREISEDGQRKSCEFIAGSV